MLMGHLRKGLNIVSKNLVILIGNLTRDPELRYSSTGTTAICKFGLATSERYKDRDGNQQEKVEYHNIVAWRQLAEICGKYLHKGKQVYVEGKLTTRKWQDKEGQDRYTTEIVIDEMQMLGGKGEAGGSKESASQGQQRSDRGNSAPQQIAPFGDEDMIPF